MKFHLFLLFILTPFFVNGEGQSGMEEWTNTMTFQGILCYAIFIGLALMLYSLIVFKRLSLYQSLKFLGIGFGLSTIVLVILILQDLELAFIIPYLFFLETFK